MYLENLVFDAFDPRRLGQFWKAALGCEPLTDSADLYETGLRIPGGPDLDLCFQRVPDPPSEPLRLHLDLNGKTGQADIVERLLALGATHRDIGQGAVDWVVLADPEGNHFCVLEGPGEVPTSGPIAALPIDCADPEACAGFWSWLTGWTRFSDEEPIILTHASGRGIALEFWPEAAPKLAKNRFHLDVRLEADDDLERVLAELNARGGEELHPGWGELPFTVCADPSGNEFCLLPARAG